MEAIARSMIVYHGTTSERARRIAREGLRPRVPSKRVWFAQDRAYARQRAQSQARRTQDRPVVLTCDIDLDGLRRKYGRGKVIVCGSVISIRGQVPPEAIRFHTTASHIPETPRELARWINSVLDVKDHLGVSPRHEGIRRLAEWIGSRMERKPREHISGREILARAREWMPDCFAGFEVDLRHVRTWRRAQWVPWDGDEGDIDEAEDERVGEALECLDAPKAQRRMRGLRLLSEMEHPDLFEWCAMMLEDPQVEVQIAACKAMRMCTEIEVEVVECHGRSEDKRLRAAAVEVLAMRGGERALDWFWRGLTDPENHVRLSVTKHLDRLDPRECRDLFDAALHDPHPHIAEVARRLTRGKGFGMPDW